MVAVRSQPTEPSSFFYVLPSITPLPQSTDYLIFLLCCARYLAAWEPARQKASAQQLHGSSALREAPMAPRGAPLQPRRHSVPTPMEIKRPRGASLQRRRSFNDPPTSAALQHRRPPMSIRHVAQQLQPLQPRRAPSCCTTSPASAALMPSPAAVVLGVVFCSAARRPHNTDVQPRTAVVLRWPGYAAPACICNRDAERIAAHAAPPAS